MLSSLTTVPMLMRKWSIGCWPLRTLVSGWRCSGSTSCVMPTPSAITAITRCPSSPYRDYVIRSFNENKPFDRFTEEQLGGDLMPGPTTDDKVASTYNRLLQTTEEGGAQAKEYIAKYDADRVRNVSTVWMGSTMACCQCHDHKFDPFTTKDFYSMASFFADIQEAAVGSRGPGNAGPHATAGAGTEADRSGNRRCSQRSWMSPTPELASGQAAMGKEQIRREGNPLDRS